MSTSCPIVLTHICLSVPSDKAENGEPYQRRRGAGTPLPDSPPAFPMARDAALTASSSSWRRILLMILAITIHNIPGKAQLSAWLSINLPIPLSVHPCTLPIADAELDTAQEDFLGLPSPFLLFTAACRWHLPSGIYHTALRCLHGAEPMEGFGSKTSYREGKLQAHWCVFNICSLTLLPACRGQKL